MRKSAFIISLSTTVLIFCACSDNNEEGCVSGPTYANTSQALTKEANSSKLIRSRSAVDINKTDTSNPVLDVIPAGETADAYVPCKVAQADCDRQKLTTKRLSAYGIQKHEVTEAEFKACFDDKRCKLKDFADNTESRLSQLKHPNKAIALSHDDASAYCKANGMSLPSPEQWLYAAIKNELKDYVWGDGKVGGEFAKEKEGDDISEPGAFPRDTSWCGAVDMAGNATEWVRGHAMGKYEKGYKCMDSRTWPTMGNARKVKIYEQFGSNHRMSIREHTGFRCVKKL